MIRERVVIKLCELAISLGSEADGTEWHLFGSVGRDDSGATDIDLMILCKDDDQADTLRRAIDSDAFELPLHLALMTFDEAAGVHAVQVQESRKIFP